MPLDFVVNVLFWSKNLVVFGKNGGAAVVVVVIARQAGTNAGDDWRLLPLAILFVDAPRWDLVASVAGNSHRCTQVFSSSKWLPFSDSQPSYQKWMQR
jgi:hypothetical protein